MDPLASRDEPSVQPHRADDEGSLAAWSSGEWLASEGTWYAVDAEGQVARLRCGVGGCLPRRYLERVGFGMTWEVASGLLLNAGASWDAADLCARGPRLLVSTAEGKPRWRELSPSQLAGLEPDAAHRRLRQPFDGESIVLRLRDARDWDRLTDDLHNAGATQAQWLPIAEAPLVHIVDALGGGLAVQLAGWLAEGIVERAWVDVVGDRKPLGPARLGIFGYGMADPHRYQLEAAPARPWRVNELPAPLAELARVVRFPEVDFSRSEMLEPGRFHPCLGYDGASQRPIAIEPAPLRAPAVVPLPPHAVALLERALAAPEDASLAAVFGDALRELGHPLALAAAERGLIPDALALLPAERQARLALAVYEPALDQLATLTRDRRPFEAWLARRDWQDGLVDDTELEAARLGAVEAGFGEALAVASPRLVDVAREAVWLACAASREPWEATRAAARRELAELIAQVG